MPTRINLKFKFEKETPGTRVYRECDAHGNKIDNMRECVIGTIYVQKNGAIGKEAPKELDVEVTISG